MGVHTDDATASTGDGQHEGDNLTGPVDDESGADDEYERRAATWKHERTTTIVLERLSDGSWHATQRDVAVHGRGETAAAAAAAYCRRVDGDE